MLKEILIFTVAILVLLGLALYVFIEYELKQLSKYIEEWDAFGNSGSNHDKSQGNEVEK